MRQANAAVIRERHPIPTVDEGLNQSALFNRLDMKWVFHQTELKQESRGITTVVTHQELNRYKQLMFGIICAPEISHTTSSARL